MAARPRTRPLYGSCAWAYDLLVAQPGGGGADEVARRLRSLVTRPGALVIDAGCGTGRYAHALAAAGFRVIGIDRSEPLLAQARERAPDIRFEAADLTAWRCPEPAEAVLCRGVLNDLVTDHERQAAIAAFARWLRPGGVLVADVRDWDATVARYADRPRDERSVRDLRFIAETTLDPHHRCMRVSERYVMAQREEIYDFAMRCWTAAELRERLATAGFAKAEISRGEPAGVAPDRLLAVARR